MILRDHLNFTVLTVISFSVAIFPTLPLAKPQLTSSMIVLFLVHHLLQIWDEYLPRALPTKYVSILPRLLFSLFHSNIFRLPVNFFPPFLRSTEALLLLGIPINSLLCCSPFVLTLASRGTLKVGFLFLTRLFLHPLTAFNTKLKSVRHWNTAIMCEAQLRLPFFLLLTRIRGRTLGSPVNLPWPQIGSYLLISEQLLHFLFSNAIILVSVAMSSLRLFPFPWLSFFSYSGVQSSLLSLHP